MQFSKLFLGHDILNYNTVEIFCDTEMMKEKVYVLFALIVINERSNNTIVWEKKLQTIIRVFLLIIIVLQTPKQQRNTLTLTPTPIPYTHTHTHTPYIDSTVV